MKHLMPLCRGTYLNFAFLNLEQNRERLLTHLMNPILKFSLVFESSVLSLLLLKSNCFGSVMT